MLVVIIVNVYAVLLVRPVMVRVVDVVPASASTPPAGFEETVYPVIGLPPSLAGGEKLSPTC